MNITQALIVAFCAWCGGLFVGMGVLELLERGLNPSFLALAAATLVMGVGTLYLIFNTVFPGGL